MDLQAELRRPATAAHEAALRAVQKPPAKPWRGGAAAPPPPPPKVYRVEPREFRDLVQRLTGAPPTAAAPRGAVQAQAAMHQPQQPVAVRVGGDQQQIYGGSPWFSFPFDGANGGLM
ncbi:hypothetical protein HU200_060890 [Digitaria exilis]|uniref:VQ domain-containing protein n=1 Tax=Digitaria exilis TaxID=1010633 RepID=A0A835ABG3_9POAL|nr:hypothetical protein HU200_060890 [Digitaria exilis]